MTDDNVRQSAAKREEDSRRRADELADRLKAEREQAAADAALPEDGS